MLYNTTAAAARAAKSPPTETPTWEPAPVKGTVELPECRVVVGLATPLGLAMPVAWIWPSAIWEAPFILDGYGVAMVAIGTEEARTGVTTEADDAAELADVDAAYTVATSPRRATVNDFISDFIGKPIMNEWVGGLVCRERMIGNCEARYCS